MFSLRANLLFVTALFAFAAVASAQPVPSFSAVTPAYLKQGQSIELSLSGTNLGGASGVFLTDPRGLAAEIVPEAKPVANRVKLKLSAAADASLGVRELRVITPLGVSPAYAVAVGQYAAVVDEDAKHGPDHPQPAALPAAIIGRVETPGDFDAFSFDAKKGQKLVFDLYSGRLGSPLDPVVSVLDSKGREQPRLVSIRPAGDEAIVFDVPADGTYTLTIRDLQFRGGGDYAYRIDAGQIPLVETILPASARRGEKVEVRAVGYNLGDSPVTTIDLKGVNDAAVPVRFDTPFGKSNDVLLSVTDVQQVAEKPIAAKPRETNAKPAPTPVSLPAEVSGVLAQPGEEDVFAFSVPAKQSITIETVARKNGSAVDALITLRDKAGAILEQNNGAGEIEARISRAFEPGDYTISIRDLSFGGGSSYGYRLHLFPATGLKPDFVVRFMPDAIRLPRGGHARVWCEVVRQNGYKGYIAVNFDGLPSGVSVTGGPAVIGEVTSGIFTLSASADAPIVSSPIKLKAVGTFGAQQSIRYGDPEVNARPARAAYLSVLEANPFTLDSLSAVKQEQIAAYGPEVQRLNARLTGASPDIDAAQAAWEKKVGAPTEWLPVAVTKATGTGGTEFKVQPDGSIHAGGPNLPEKDTYTVTANVNVPQIAAVRLEALTDPTLPQNGPGRKDINGNFVLNTFAVAIAPKADPAKKMMVKFASGKATHEQGSYAISGAIDDSASTGWAIDGGTGKPQTAWFYADKPIPAGDVILTVTLDQQYGERHLLGKFRLAVSADPNAKAQEGDALPAPVAAALKVPADKRSPEQKAIVAAHYRSISPELSADRQKLEALRATVGPYTEVARLQAMLEQNTPALAAEQKEWEASAGAGLGWMAVEVTAAKSANGTVLVNEKDGSVFAQGNAPATDTYTLTTSTPLRTITAIRLEALPDDRLPGNGPGRMADGNFILTRFTVSATAKNAQAAGGDKAGPVGGTIGPVVLRDPRASFEQANYPIAAAFDEKPDTGWAISPLLGRPHTATFYPRQPIAGPEGGTALTFTLEFASPSYAGASLGRFRIWVLGAADPATAPRIPAEIQEILKISETYRTDTQRAELSEFYRSISPALEPTRQRIAELRDRLPSLNVVVAKGKTAAIPVPLTRTPGFSAPVTITLEGFVAGRDPQSRQPNAATKSLDVQPLQITPEQATARLSVKPRGNSEIGTRMVVLRAEAEIGNDTYVSYSPAFPITVTEK